MLKGVQRWDNGLSLTMMYDGREHLGASSGVHHAIKAALGDLDRVERVVKVTGYVNAALDVDDAVAAWVHLRGFGAALSNRRFELDGECGRRPVGRGLYPLRPRFEALSSDRPIS